MFVASALIASTGLLDTWDIAIRLGMAVVVGSLLGLNRELMHKPAGVRTHALVALGAALIVTMGMEAPASGATFDANALTRIFQGILTGIGFLGAGVILRSEKDMAIHGLTTAATIWTVACLGMACGGGRWRIVFLGTTLAIVVLTLGRSFEDRVLPFLDRYFGSEGPRGQG